jgi:two-component system, NtrC family, response regulator HydG
MNRQIAGHVLLVDDEEQILATTKLGLQTSGIREVLTLNDCREVLPLLARESIAVMVLDLSMPHVSGLELLVTVTRDFSYIRVIIVTADDEIDTVVECMKLGAFDCLPKPVDSNRLVVTVLKALQFCSLSSELASLKQRLLTDNLDNADAFASIVTHNKKMRAMFQYLEVIAGSPRPILITGETGVGKELVARAIHELSGCKGEFIALNAAVLDDAMSSDTVFGHREGGFTGACQAREGLMARAAGGTVFLDEIGDLSDMSQVKLLRFLQGNDYHPLGSELVRKSDAQMVLATNCDLKQRIAVGEFRNELYYRLCAHVVQIPPLRERRDDLPLLLDHFIRQEAVELGLAPPSYPKELVNLLETYHFPGNIRELQAMVRCAMLRSDFRGLSLESFVELGQGSISPFGGN